MIGNNRVGSCRDNILSATHGACREGIYLTASVKVVRRVRLNDKPRIASPQGAQIRQSLGYEAAEARRMGIDRMRPFRQA